MIAPASTRAPAYSLTPSRCPALSRPLRVPPATDETAPGSGSASRNTRAPAYSLTPSRCPALSRPLRVEPAPFLCAMSLCLDLRDSESRLVLPVAARLPRTRLVLVLEHPDLRSSSMPDDLGRDDVVVHEGGP